MDERPHTTDNTAGFNHETPAGAAAVDDELTEWEELLSANVNEHKRRRDMEGVRDRWESAPNAPEGSAKNSRRMEDYEARFPDPDEGRDAGVIRTVVGALDPRQFYYKSVWAAVILVLLAGILVPFAVGAGIMTAIGAPVPVAALVGMGVTLAYWRFC